MSTEAPFPPPGMTADVWLEASHLVGAVVGGVAYGLHVAIFAECMYRIFPRPSLRATANSWWLVAFIFIMFATGTLNFACNTRMTQLMFINNRAFPGGPMAWFFTNYAITVNTAGNSAYIIANFFADALLLWRCCVVWNTVWIMILPLLVFLCSTVLSILTLFQASRPDASLWSNTTIQISLPYFSISIALNVLITLLLVGRLWYMSRRVRRTIGVEHAATYNSIASMLIESAVPYTITGVVFIILYARNSNLQNIVLSILGQIMCITPEVIILRVALGRAVTSQTFASQPRSGHMSLEFRRQTMTQHEATFQHSYTAHSQDHSTFGSSYAQAKHDFNLSREDV